MKRTLSYLPISALILYSAANAGANEPEQRSVADLSIEVGSLLKEQGQKSCLDMFCTGQEFTKRVIIGGLQYEVIFTDAPLFVNVPANHIRPGYVALQIDECTTDTDKRMSSYAQDCTPKRRWFDEQLQNKPACYDFKPNVQKGTRCKLNRGEKKRQFSGLLRQVQEALRHTQQYDY